MPRTVNAMTVAQAMVNFLSAQHSASDGVEQKLFAGCFGIFGHGNVAGFGQALLQAELEEPDAAAVRARAQRAGDGAHRRRLRPDEGAPPDLGRLHQRRTRRDQHGHRRRAGHDQPAARAAAAGRHLRRPPALAAAAGAGAAVRRRPHRQRLLPARLALLRPDLAARAAAARADERDAGAHRPGRRPARSRSASPRTCRPRPTTGPSSCSSGGSGTSPGRCPRRAVLEQAAATIRAPAAARRRRRRRALLRRTDALAAFCARPASRSGRPRPARARSSSTTRSASGRSGPPARRRPTRSPRRPTWSSGSAPATPTSPPRAGRRSRTRTSSSSTSTSPGSTPSSSPGSSVVADARETLEALTALLAGHPVDQAYVDRYAALDAEWERTVTPLFAEPRDGARACSARTR